MTNQDPSLYFSRHPKPRGTQALSHHHTHVQMGVHRAYAYQGTTGGSSGAQIPLNLHHGPHPVNAMAVNTSHSGVPRSLHSIYNVR